MENYRIVISIVSDKPAAVDIFEVIEKCMSRECNVPYTVELSREVVYNRTER